MKSTTLRHCKNHTHQSEAEGRELREFFYSLLLPLYSSIPPGKKGKTLVSISIIMVSIKSVNRHIVFRTYIAQILEIMIVLGFLAFNVNVVAITYNGAFNYSSFVF